MVARTFKPLSHFTRNIALGSASRTAPSNSSLSPLGSFGSRCCLRAIKILRNFASYPDALEEAAGHFIDRADTIHPTQKSFVCVESNQRCRLCRVCRETFLHNVFAVIV